MSKISIVSLLPVDSDGFMRQSFLLAYAVSDYERAIYGGQVQCYAPDAITAAFEHAERYVYPNALDYTRGPWTGKPEFGQKAPGGTALKEIRHFARTVIGGAVSQKRLLRLALTVATTQEQAAQRWARTRISFAVTSDASDSTQHYRLEDIAEWAVEVVRPFSEQVQRLRTLHRTMRELYADFRLPDSDFEAAL